MEQQLAYGDDDTRGAVLVAVMGLLLFLVYVATIDAVGWLQFPLGPVAAILSGLACLNVGLALVAPVWTRWRSSAWAYEGFHAVMLTLVLYYFGGTAMSICLMIYAFLVVHTELLRPDASVFVTANLCGLCYGVLALLEHLAWVTPPPVLPIAVTGGQRIAFVSFTFLSLNFLALYATRHGSQLRQVAMRLESLVAKRTEDLTRSNAALRAKQDEVQAFVYSVTHDLKNPLNSVLLTAQLVLRRDGTTLTPTAIGDLEQIARTAAHGENMLRDLLGLFRVTAAPEDSQTVELRTLVGEALDTLGPQIAERGIRIDVGPLPPVVGQPTKLLHLVHNLLGNAVKYVPDASGRIAVSGYRENGRVELRVQDNGIGVPPVYQDRIFELFGRVPEGQQLVGGQPVGGTGVGLALVKRIAEEHGGRVWVESTPGAGSCFVVQLRASGAPAGGSGSPPGAPVKGSSHREATGGEQRLFS